MPKTYCFLYRRQGSTVFKAVFVKACGIVQAISLAKRMINDPGTVVYVCFPARRKTIRHYINVMHPGYKGWCNG